MKRALTLLLGALLMITATVTLATGSQAGFKPAIHNADNLPPGILYMDTGSVDLVKRDLIVVNDASYPYYRRVQVFSKDGLKITRKKLQKGQTVDLYANDHHEAVYIVQK